MEALIANLFLPTVIILVGLIQFFTPRLTRPDIWFSVTVDPSFRDSEEGRRVLKSYRLWISIHSVVALALAVAGLRTQEMMAVTGGVFWQIVGSTLAFIAAHRRVLPHGVAPSPIREAGLGRRTSLPGGLLLQAGPFVILAATAAWLALNWNQLPARIPIRWSLDGSPNGWVPRTPWDVHSSLLQAAAHCLFALLLAWLVQTFSRRVRAAGPAGQAEQKFRVTTLSVLLAVEYLIAFSAALPKVFAVVSSPTVALVAISLGSLGLVVACFFLFVRTGQGGARLVPAEAGAAAAPVGDRTENAHWKFGLFYVNRGDPALFIEKRFGFGYTLNLGNPWAWIVLGAMLSLPPLLRNVF